MAAHLTKAKDAASASSDVPTTFKVFDSLGTGYDLNGTMEKIGPNTWTFTPVGTIVDPATGATIAKVSTTPANSSVTINFNPATGTFSSSSMGAGGAAAAGKGAAPAPAASGAKGAASSSPAGSGFSITITPTGSPTSFTVNPDFSAMTQYDSPSTAAPFRTDGYPAGSLAKLTVSSTGMFVAAYTNGQTANKAQVALFNFNNPGGLEKAGGNMYLESNNSGVARKDEVSSVNSGSLEMSNVDLAAQFSDMIVTQRGFQANSKTITTVDTMLEELVNLKR
jgi:flagellar hook protein FlgE